MKTYEITFITKEDQKEKPVKPEIEKLGGKILKSENLGQKSLVYPIKKETAAFFTTIVFEIDPEKVIELNKKLSLDTEILRFLIITFKAAKVQAPKVKIQEKEEIIKEEKPKIKKTAKKLETKVEEKKAIVKEIEAEEMTSDERLKALDKKLDELLKE